MDSKKILETSLGTDVIRTINEKITRKYKVNPEDSMAMVENLILGNHELLKLIENGGAIKRIEKSKIFRTIVQLAKKKIYYLLRQYDRNQELQKNLIKQLQEASPRQENTNILSQLALTHISTKERIADIDIFYQNFFEHFPDLNTIVDIGCGIHPITFPFSEQQLSLYLGLEKDQNSIRILNAFKKTIPTTANFIPVRWNIQEGWETIQQNYTKSFDIALMFKLVPVVMRTDPEMVEVLKNTPAPSWIVSGSKFSMTKKESIEKRERRIISKFIRASGKEIIDEFSISEEFFYVLQE